MWALVPDGEISPHGERERSEGRACDAHSAGGEPTYQERRKPTTRDSGEHDNAKRQPLPPPPVAARSLNGKGGARASDGGDQANPNAKCGPHESNLYHLTALSSRVERVTSRGA